MKRYLILMLLIIGIGVLASCDAITSTTVNQSTTMPLTTTSTTSMLTTSNPMFYDKSYFERSLLQFDNDIVDTKEVAQTKLQAIMQEFLNLDVNKMDDIGSQMTNAMIDGKLAKDDFQQPNLLQYYHTIEQYMVSAEIAISQILFTNESITNFTEEEPFIYGNSTYTVFVNDHSYFFQEINDDGSSIVITKITYKLFENGEYIFEFYNSNSDSRNMYITYESASSENGFIKLNVTDRGGIIGYMKEEADFVNLTYHREFLQNVSTSFTASYKRVDLNSGEEYGFYRFHDDSGFRLINFVSFLNDDHEYIFNQTKRYQDGEFQSEENNFSLLSLEGWDYVKDNAIYSDDTMVTDLYSMLDWGNCVRIDEPLTESLLAEPISGLAFSGVSIEVINEMMQMSEANDDSLDYVNDTTVKINGVEYSNFDQVIQAVFVELPELLG